VTVHGFFAPTPRGLEGVLRRELADLGARRVEQVAGGVRFEGPLALGFEACLWLRTASRVLVHLARVEAPDADGLYAAVRALPWEGHVDPATTFAVRTTARRSPLDHLGYATLRIKDAIVDRVRAVRGRRPSVDRDDPDVPVAVHLAGRVAHVYVDLSRGSLHRRGYRADPGPAPLAPHVAAGLVALAGFDPARPDLEDPCCGGGTIAVEACLWALDGAPGLFRAQAPALAWPPADRATFERIAAAARARFDRARAERRFVLRGFDVSAGAVARARDVAARAGLADHLTFERRGVDELAADDGVARVVTNPPYGKRLAGGGPAELAHLVARLRRVRPAARLFLLLPEDAVDTVAGDAAVRAKVRNGPIRCRFVELTPPGRTEAGAPSSPEDAGGRRPARDADLEAFARRVQKRDAHLRKWARRRGVEAYRVYDADVPAFAFCIERYGDHVAVWEYAPPPSIPEAKAAARRRAALERLPSLLSVPREHVVFKTRRPVAGGRLAAQAARAPRPFVVREGPFRFLVDLDAHLDTGLFLDHRGTRAHLCEVARGKRFLNLFCYTGSATVAAACGGAARTVSVDLSRTYLAVLEENLRRCGAAGPRHALVRADVMDFVASLPAGPDRFDLVFVDPPTFSASKKMASSFEVERDHVRLLGALVPALAPGGRIYFAAHKRGFRLDRAGLEAVGLSVEEWTGRFAQPDFPLKKGKPPPHRLFVLARTGGRGGARR